MRRCLLWIVMSFLLVATTTQQAISQCSGPNGILSTSIIRTPSQSTTRNSLSIRISVIFPDLCWRRLVLDSFRLIDSAIYLYSTAVNSGQIRLFVLISHNFTVKVNSPAPGNYTVISLIKKIHAFSGRTVLYCKFYS